MRLQGTLLFEGWITLAAYGDSDDQLFLHGGSIPVELGGDGETTPLGELLQDAIGGRIVTVRYWTTQHQCTLQDAAQDFMLHLCGLVESSYGTCYSEITGYLFTDEDVMIAGHDLLAEFASHEGQWLILEIELDRDCAIKEL